ncbi:hypothetical protein [Streptomyces sp. CAI-85]|uniref:hypothetical protein n=1 Tax=Streptomyces sp. CAI-85 TaxID=1472662 RepID=UPI001587026F|nr:hypothetical protein [Streptomyces sp. CAI-85]NUV60647.1 hypothetical protein [Streptomyces sp. CAI-85]
MYVQETGAPGWFEVAFPDVVPRILIKAVEKDGRWVVGNLILVSEALDSAALKSIPIARIESLLNTRTVTAALFARQSGATQGPPEGVTPFRAESEQLDTALSTYLDRSPRPSFPPPEAAPQREPLARPDGTDPDAFYRRVAEVYNDAVRETAAPAKVLAEEAGVPTTTVHRWIFEARRRGFLPPARKGRAG